MAIFNPLPNVNNCCFCISLKWGSVIIAILTALSFCCVGVSLNLYCITDIQSLDILRHIIYVVECFLVIAAVIFLVGICMDKGITATIFLYTVSICIILALITFVIIMIYSATQENCTFRYDVIVHAIISIIIWFYFLCVVKSYREEMG
ncbi:hypothetical protein ACJJTC_016188 [Scirpophaga incertulas]